MEPFLSASQGVSDRQGSPAKCVHIQAAWIFLKSFLGFGVCPVPEPSGCVSVSRNPSSLLSARPPCLSALSTTWDLESDESHHLLKKKSNVIFFHSNVLCNCKKCHTHDFISSCYNPPPCPVLPVALATLPVVTTGLSFLSVSLLLFCFIHSAGR